MSVNSQGSENEERRTVSLEKLIMASNTKNHYDTVSGLRSICNSSGGIDKY
jgi:hypothetical protein